MGICCKCSKFCVKLDHLKSRNQFFCLREFEPAATPVVTQKGKKYIMLGSNNYLGLVDHADV